jgi:hypothetical protein
MQVRAKVEHSFRMIKCQFGYIKDTFSWASEESGATDDIVCIVEPENGSRKFA